MTSDSYSSESACNWLKNRMLAGDACCKMQQASISKALIISDILADTGGKLFTLILCISNFVGQWVIYVRKNYYICQILLSDADIY